MLLTLIIVLSALVTWTFVKWETVSPKLLVRESATLVGTIVGATPELVRTTTKAVKAANLATELELKEAGSEGPKGFNIGRVNAAVSTRAAFKATNISLERSLKLSQIKLDRLAKAESKES